jgi:amino acid adenylation domain-containing protein
LEIRTTTENENKERGILMTVQKEPTESYLSTMTVHGLFERQAQKTPSRIAVEYCGETISYESLNHQAKELADRLKAQGVTPDCVVGLCVERSIRMVIGVLGIMKSGAAYLPMEHNDPQQRLEFMLGDAGARIVVSETRYRHQFHRFEGLCLLIDERHEPLGTTDPKTSIPAAPDNLAYIIYTSGSTGKPKGVAIEHKSVVNRLLTMGQHLGIGDREVVLSIGSYAFDGTLPDWYWALMYGGKVILAEGPVIRDPKLLIEKILSTRPTHFQAPPLLWDMMIAEGIEWPRNLRAISMGEHMSEALRDKLRRCNDEVWNLYGPTETSIWACACNVVEDRNPNSIGTPLAQTPIYIQKSCGQLAEVNEIGELLIGGAGLARGYLGLPELTQQRFAPVPEIGSDRFYRTGDLGRWNADGSIEFFGRNDHQVKIRGYRIELGEIDYVLQRHEDVVSCVTIARDNQHGHKQLHSYAVLTKDCQTRYWEFRDFLERSLSEHMIPTSIEILDALPVNANGKIDRAALPEPRVVSHQLKNPYVAPMGDLQCHLATIWREVLELDQIGVDDNFFEVGGESLTAMMIVNRIEKIFQRRISIAEMFGNPTIRLLSKLLEDRPSLHSTVHRS